MAGRAPTAILETLLADDHALRRVDLDDVTAQELLETAAAEQIVPLAARALDARAPGSAHAVALHAAAAAWALREAAERQAIREFLDAARDVPLMFFKGASLAYGTYASSALRMKDDWDVLAAPGAHAEAARALLAAGFKVDAASKPGRVRMRQQSFRRPVPGSECIVDLHMRTLNPPALAGRIPFGDLAAHGIALPALHASARGVAEPAALVVACVHRLAHHSAEPRLAWDYDLLLLLRRATADGLAEIGALATRWGAGAFVSAEARRVLARFGEPMPPGVADMLEAVEGDAGGAPGFLEVDRSRAREFALDWRELGWRDRGALLVETLLPSATFMRASTGSKWPLPALYARRILRGVRGWFRAR